MHKRFALFFAAALMALDAGGARAQDATAAARREIEAGYAAMSAAFKREDAEGVLAPATSNFEVRAPGGRTLSREAARQNLQNNFDTIRTVRENRYNIQKVTLRSGSAVVLVNERSAVVFMDSRGEFGAVGKTHDVVSATDYRDTWVKEQDGAWRLRRSEILATRLTLNGKPYRPTTTRPRRQPSR